MSTAFDVLSDSVQHLSPVWPHYTDILVDRAEGEIPSMAERFQRRTGRTVAEVLGG